MNKYEDQETGLRRFTSTCPIRINDEQQIRVKFGILDSNGIVYRYGRIVTTTELKALGLSANEEDVTVICEVEEVEC